MERLQGRQLLEEGQATVTGDPGDEPPFARLLGPQETCKVSMGAGAASSFGQNLLLWDDGPPMRLRTTGVLVVFEVMLTKSHGIRSFDDR